MKTHHLLPILTLSTLSGLISPHASADTLGVYLGSSYWSPSFSGDFKSASSGQGQIGLKKDLGYSSGSANHLYLVLEHPLPMVPELRIDRTNLSETSRNRLERTIEFRDTTYNAGTEVSSEFDLSHTDFTAYYELLDDTLAASLDLGVTLRIFDGEVRIDQEHQKLDAHVPLLYGSGQVRIPGTDFSAGGSMQYINTGDIRLTDYRVFVSYTPVYVLSGELGYRSFNLELDDVDSLDADFDAKGVYASVYLHF
ncbi:TIGR04219 family outer membrane beta-barrel protein [Oceanospirillum sediminis]|uniref:TIGR04219 family outer membrane beta-barrel protein n=1 Tax=Oceanospirillum sediminis TaxID=2760088 RepID=A0A839IU46_9GAMM|nr:TIGR04219 family outer membrane beta-barrel protein [Oceanospirillum sediminis]MBB1488461.1 TIGR04219 family outer membrane beta-barrel protein [Oceanospirillum sediminis]